MGIEPDHSSISKFANFDAPGFESVAEAIQRYTLEAPDVVTHRWAVEKKERAE